MVGSARTLIAALAASLLVSAAGSAGEAPAAKTGAAWPKGAYAALDKLPDWGGVWVLGRAPAGASREQPQLKGEYKAKYEAWQKATRDNNGQAVKDTSNCMP